MFLNTEESGCQVSLVRPAATKKAKLNKTKKNPTAVRSYRTRLITSFTVASVNKKRVNSCAVSRYCRKKLLMLLQVDV